MNPESAQRTCPCDAAILYEEADSEQLTTPSGELLWGECQWFVRKFEKQSGSGLETVSVLARTNVIMRTRDSSD